MKGLKKSFGSLEVLKGIDLTIGKGEVVSIVGPSGAGKSSLSKAVAKALGIIYVDTGALYRTVGYYARAIGLPADKVERVERLLTEKNPRRTLVFVGDGINDAPVLAGADVGAAMGSGADAAIEAADVVFMTSDVAAIPESLYIAKQTARIAWQNVVFALAVKLLVMVLALFGYASMWLAVFADSGVAMLCVLNAIRLLYRKK